MFHCKPGTVAIKKEFYGIYLTLSGKICAMQVKQWMEDIKPMLHTMNKKFNLIVDLREVLPLCSEAATVLTYARAYLHGKGLHRTAIVYESSASIIELMSKFNQLSNDPNERHVSCMVDANWKETALNWVSKGIEP